MLPQEGQQGRPDTGVPQSHTRVLQWPSDWDGMTGIPPTTMRVLSMALQLAPVPWAPGGPHPQPSAGQPRFLSCC